MADTGGLPPEITRGSIGAAVTAIGGALGWIFRSRATAKRRRDERLDAWHRELEEREKRLAAGQSDYVTKLEKRVADVEAKEREREAKDEARDEQLRALRLAFELVSSALRKIDAGNLALVLAEDLLKAAFPIQPDIPLPMQETLRRIDGATDI